MPLIYLYGLLTRIPGETGPSIGIGRLSIATLRTSGVKFIQYGISVKNCAIGPNSRLAVGYCLAGISWSM